MTEAEGRQILRERFEAAGLTIAEDQPVRIGNATVTLDGWDAAKSIGYEFLTTEAGDREEVTQAVLAELDALVAAGKLHVLVIDEAEATDILILEAAAAGFLMKLKLPYIVTTPKPSGGGKAYTVSDFLTAAARQAELFDKAVEALQRRKVEHAKRVEDVTRQRDEAVIGFAKLLLPEFSAAAVKRAATLSAYAPLMTGDPLGAMAKEETKLKADLAGMEADPKYRDRVALRAPGVGTLDRDLRELEEYRASIAAVLQKAEHPRLSRLIDAEYGTKGYKEKWWRASFYWDWEAGDAILERFPEYKTFGELRDEILKSREDLGVYDKRIGELKTEILAGEQLEQAHDAAAERLANLASIHLADWQARLGRHAMENPETVAERVKKEADLDVLLKTLVGLGKKLEYLDQLAQTQLDEPLEEIKALREKLERDRYKFARPKNAALTFPADKFEKRFKDRTERIGKRARRYDVASRTLLSFTDYGHARFAEDFLWWDLMTDGRIDGNDLDEVEEFRREHPDYVWRPDRFDDRGAAAAAAEADRRASRDRLSDAS